MPRFAFSLLLSLSVSSVFAELPQAVAPGEKLEDVRFGPLRTLESYFPFQPVESKQAWQDRAEALRLRAKIANGLWPEPKRTPLNAVVHGLVDRPEYTVERVFFESLPGHFVTGSLYRPKPQTHPAAIRDGRRPVVLCPHGHWNEGRFHDHGEATARREIAIGAERFEREGRYPLQARCVQLARMGCLVFHYDMEGYADSVQLAHRTDADTPLNEPDRWGFFSTRAEAHLQNKMGLQSWNSIRAIDFVTALPDVDPARIAVTGASGGGTQTLLIGALDDRPAALLPAVMTSTAMQGGCTCENAPLLRIGAGNIDLAALAAPRPLGLTSADDWTKELATKGEPDLKKLYALLGKPNHFNAYHFTHFKHNYNGPSRTAMYGFMNRHLGLGLKEPVLETAFEPLTRDELTVWNTQHPKPAGHQTGTPHEQSITRWMTEDARHTLDRMVPTDAQSLEAYRRVVGSAFDTVLGRRYADAGSLKHENPTQKIDQGNHLMMTGILENTTYGENIPLLFIHPKKNWNQTAVIWLHGAGKSALLDAQGAPIAAVKQLIDAGFSVIGVDLIGQGEHIDDNPLTQARMVIMYGGTKAWHQFAGYTYGYNPSLIAQRSHDVLSVIRFAKTDRHEAKRVILIATDGAGPVGAAALAQSDGAIDRAILQTDGFRFADLPTFNDLNFLPGGAKYHDLPGLLALAAPTPLHLIGEPEHPAITRAAYTATGMRDALSHEPDANNPAAAAVIQVLKNAKDLRE